MLTIISGSRPKVVSECVAAGRTFIVDFYSKDCRPCQMLEKQLPRVAEVIGRVGPILQVCIDDLSEDIPGVTLSALPAVVFYKDGEIVNQLDGLRPIPEYIAAAEALVSK